jgi:hypothetical protein
MRRRGGCDEVMVQSNGGAECPSPQPKKGESALDMALSVGQRQRAASALRVR